LSDYGIQGLRGSIGVLAWANTWLASGTGLGSHAEGFEHIDGERGSVAIYEAQMNHALPDYVAALNSFLGPEDKVGSALGVFGADVALLVMESNGVAVGTTGEGSGNRFSVGGSHRE